MAGNLGKNIKIIDDDNLNAYLSSVGERIVHHLPPTKMNFRFYLIDLADVNAFSIAGGRVYIARKVVALAQSEDELAGVIAHELGHIVTHQTSILVTRRLREVLGVTRVGDRADIFARYHELLENAARKLPKSEPDEEKEQYTADQVALYAMARAGYSPHAYVDLWDRFQQTHGKTGGSWFSSLFVEIKPAERRLGEMVKNVSTMPAECADTPPTSHAAEFAKWKVQVINYSEAGTKQFLPGLLLAQTLALPLRPDIFNLRFSPDGKYILAQDEGGIHVLTREPLAVTFFIPAIDALGAKFTPDSQSIVFNTSALRVESWSLKEQQRTSVYELTLLNTCVQSELSPDGSVLACLDDRLHLSLVDVHSGTYLAGKKPFVELTDVGRLIFAVAAAAGNARFIEMHFSPDGRYFLAGAGGANFAWDITNRRELPLPGSIRDILKESFAFVALDRITGIDPSSPGKSPVLRFPSGERVGQLRLANGIRLRAISKGDHLIVGPLKDMPWGLLDLNTGSLPLEFRTDGADVYENLLISERMTGELGLYRLGSAQPQAAVKLPQARLGSLQAVAVSPEFEWLAMSNRTRGAVWDISHNIRTMELRGFRGAWIGKDQTLYVDMPKFEQLERYIARLDPTTGADLGGYKTGDVIANQYGPYLVVTKPKQKEARSNAAEVEIQDVRDGHSLWRHYFPHGLPLLSFSPGAVLLTWPVDSPGGRIELQQFPELKSHGSDQDYFCELRDLRTDATLGKMRLNTNKGSFQLTNAFVAGEWLTISANNNQVLTYNFVDARQVGHFFGSRPTISAQSGWLAIDGQANHLELYYLNNSELRQDYVFPDPISFKVFSEDGKRLLVLTASQIVYILDTSVH